MRPIYETRIASVACAEGPPPPHSELEGWGVNFYSWHLETGFHQAGRNSNDSGSACDLRCSLMLAGLTL